MQLTGKTALILFIGLVGISFLLIGYTNHLILTPTFYRNNGDILGYDDSAMTAYVSIQKWIYLFEVFYLAFKLSLIALILYTTIYLVNHTVSYASIFSVVTISELVFSIAALVKLFWFQYYFPQGSLADWHKNYPLSLISFIPDVGAAWYYPLQTINVFEVTYWFLLALGISKITRLDFDSALRIVVKGYLPALIIWIACVVFITIVFFPSQT